VINAESGTGKELIARAIHALSKRSGAFVAINCGAIPQSLVETELFGYRKGAFSGASEDRLGMIRAADGGTLFLDEIGDLPPASQAAFLRVLQEREVLPIGATKPVSVDVRLVAATHRPLEELVSKGTFRADLLARISGYTVRLPPLRERREDLGMLIAALLARLAGKNADKVTFSPAAARALFKHHWPLNIRELEKCLETSVVLARGGPILPEHLPDGVRSALQQRTASADPAPEEEPRVLSDEDRARKDELALLLEQHNGNVSAVARAMGKARTQIQRWIRRYGIEAGE
jgi:sigma-54 dependent transcriptional regulator, acetoin dehydrogenase operon transcriptional activator AcoR